MGHLVKCVTCGNATALNALVCPYCGEPNFRETCDYCCGNRKLVLVEYRINWYGEQERTGYEVEQECSNCCGTGFRLLLPY